MRTVYYGISVIKSRTVTSKTDSDTLNIDNMSSNLHTNVSLGAERFHQNVETVQEIAELAKQIYETNRKSKQLKKKRDALANEFINIQRRDGIYDVNSTDISDILTSEISRRRKISKMYINISKNEWYEGPRHYTLKELLANLVIYDHGSWHDHPTSYDKPDVKQNIVRDNNKNPYICVLSYRSEDLY